MPRAWSNDPNQAAWYATRDEVVEALREAFTDRRAPHSIRITTLADKAAAA